MIDGLHWLGLFPNEKFAPRDNFHNSLCATLQANILYQPKEWDIVLLQHKFTINRDDSHVFLFSPHLS
jgi:hypothetical protein